MIEIHDLTKTYGDKTAVDHLTVTVRPGVVTGFLGPNGAGKSTTMRTIVGLDRPTGGEVLVNGHRYADLPAPLREVGALLEARAFHPGRSVIYAELIKVRSLRSMAVAAVIAALSIVAGGVLAAIGIIVSKSSPDGGTAATLDPAGGSLTGVSIAVYAVATFGVLAVSSKYASGTIKPTLAAVPRRGLLVAGKAAAVAAITFAVTLTSTVVAFFAAKAILATAGMTVSLTEPGVLRAVTGVALYLTVVAVLSSAFGWLLRSTAAAIATVVAVLVVPPVIGLLLPARIAAIVVPYLPDNAGTAIMQLAPSGQLGPWTGLAVFVGYAGAVLAGGVLVVRHRDA